MNKGILEMIVAGSIMLGIATSTSNTSYAQQQEHKTIKKTEVPKNCEKKCDVAEDNKTCCDMKEPSIKKDMTKYDINPEVIKSVAPTYPTSMVKKGIEGKVYIQMGIDKYGKPTSATIIKSSGYAPLDSSALVAVKQYQFKPAIVKDKAVESMITLPIQYKLK